MNTITNATLGGDAAVRDAQDRIRNNLQTVASLLCLQSRRVASCEARAALEDLLRRLAAIAIVHDAVNCAAGSVPFDEVSRRLARTVEGAVPGGNRICIAVEGDLGEIPVEIATPLAVVLSELLYGASESAVAKVPCSAVRLVTVRLARDGVDAVIDVDGTAMPFDSAGCDRLRVGIVSALASGQLGGSLGPRDSGGTGLRVRVPVCPSDHLSRAQLPVGAVAERSA